jgi:BirA family transcriptional regulator, biotin operon repressor / biotin---[acetyl-CoA-carboxylase] ligase
MARSTRFGFPRRHYRVTDSTNERARELAFAGASSGTMVTADAQTAGRGRRGRTWAAPPGKALLCTAILRPLDARHALLPLAAPVAVCEAVESLAPVGCQIKWPNDVWICVPQAARGKPGAEGRESADVKGMAAGSKVAGVLIEARAPEWAVIGVGINVAVDADEFPADLRWPARSVGHGVSVEDALEALCERLGGWVEAPEAAVLGEFEARDALRGRELRWQRAGGEYPDGEGIADGVDRAGNLLVETATGERIALGAGEVDLRVSGR